jgi:hypothetical protein
MRIARHTGEFENENPSPFKIHETERRRGCRACTRGLEITQPGLAEEDDIEYCNMVEQIIEEYCPLFRVPEEIRTPAEEDAAVVMREAIQDKSSRIVGKLLSSKDPLIHALAGRQRMIAE